MGRLGISTAGKIRVFFSVTLAHIPEMNIIFLLPMVKKTCFVIIVPFKWEYRT